MAHKKAGGSTALGRESQSKRLGVKRHSGERVHTGEILVRQRGTPIHPGMNTKRGTDDTIYAMANGTVRFVTKKVAKFHGNLKATKYINVDPVAVK